ncbi:MAG: 1-acyl-sn-glycerol-3-phosphate acyltransferase [Rhodobacteraceae bacterium]|nr:1-acyl-sn-glycerol-3-phosphate acyltransferase [Paracoccaceae bacterium]
MFETVEFPLWFVWIAGLLAFAGLMDRILMPSVRWYLRRRLNRAIERLNDHLQLRIQPFKLTRRRVMIDRLLHDPKVMEALTAHAETEGMPREVVAERAAVYAREIVPSFSAFAYFGFAIRLSRFLSEALYRVRLGFVDEKALAAVDPDATVVFVMNHRSNMDYVLVTYLAAQHSALSYAVGEWARVWPLQQLIRSLGAYFIRRKSRDILYRRILARYVQMATEGGVTQAIFPEGGLSLDGRPRQARLGLLSYILDGFDPKGLRDVVFVPVGLNYDRVLEDRVLTRVDPDGERHFEFRVRVFLGFVWRQLWLRLTRRFYRHGYACVSFGRPVSLKQFIAANDQSADGGFAEGLGASLMQQVELVIPVLPVPLVATALLDEGAPLSMLKLKARCHHLLQGFHAKGAYVHLPHEDEDYAVEVGLRILTSRHMVTESGGVYAVNADDRALVQYYANSIAHLRGEENSDNAT